MPGGREPLDAALPYTIGELRYGVRHELAATLGDLLIRRTHLAFETRDHGAAAAEKAAPHIAAILAWDDLALRRAMKDYAAEVERTFALD